MADDSGVLSAPLIIEYPFSRTTGPVVGAFLTGLRERVLLGITGSDGKVLVPPTEYDPYTGEDLTDLVEVGPGGTYVVRRVRHEQRELLQYVERLGLVPGTTIRLIEVGPFEGPVSIEFRGSVMHLGHKAASAIFVEAAVTNAAE